MKCLSLFTLLAFVSTSLVTTSMSAESNHPKKLLRDFESLEPSPQWRAQNDGVMGGVSTGGAELKDGALHFTGTLSLENNGGFAQIYSPTETPDFSKYTAVRLRVKGDGRDYQFRIATDARYRGSRIAYRSEFSTQVDQWTEVAIPFSAFKPSHHGRMLSGPPMDLTAVTQIAFLLGDGNPGDFTLQVDWIGLE